MKLTTPFKNITEFKKELKEFANKHRITLAEHSKKISNYFEMSCYHKIILYYESRGYKINVKNLQKGLFRYKCSPSGKLQNFSYFEAIKRVNENDIKLYLYHNATIQSAHDVRVFTTPDIVIAKTDAPCENFDYYETRKGLSYFTNDDIISFCEVKNLIPFPELMINFIGTVNELKPKCLSSENPEKGSIDLAPSLMMSGSYSKSTRRIKHSLEKRYYINMLDNLFDNSTNSVFRKYHLNELATFSHKSAFSDEDIEAEYEERLAALSIVNTSILPDETIVELFESKKGNI